MADVRLIDANKLKELLAMYLAEHIRFPDKDRTTTFVGVLDWVDSAPTIEAEPVRHGRWNTHTYSNRVDTYGNPDTCAECSKCGFQWYSVREAKCWFHYCPDCGAKMDGKEG